MKQMLLLILISMVSYSLYGQLNLDDVRRDYVEAAEDEDKAERFHEMLNGNDNTTGILLAYKAAAEALLGKHAFLPTKKVSYVKKSLKMFEEAVIKDAENIEIRYLRFTIEHHIPSFLGMSDHLKQDVEMIVKNACRSEEFSVQKDYLEQIVQFLIDSGRCNGSDIDKLKQCLQ